MDTLKRAPDSTSYAVTEGNTNIAIQLSGGLPRVRADQLNAVKTVDALWTLSPKAFNYMLAFYRTSTAFGSSPFLCPLLGIDNITLANYTAWIVPGTWKPVRQQQGLTFILTCQLWVIPTNDTSGDAAILTAGPD